MKVASADIAMTSRYEHYRAHHVKTLSRQSSFGASRVESAGQDEMRATAARVEMSKGASGVRVDLSQAGSVLSKHDEMSSLASDALAEPKWAQVKRILESFLGREIKTIDFSVAKQIDGSERSDTLGLSQAHSGLEFNNFFSESDVVELRLQEKEVVQFGVSASILLEDGSQIEVLMSEELISALDLQLTVTRGEAQKIIDPLVINLEGPLVMSSDRSEFDLDADGQTDSLANFSSDSAYLALDVNRNGKIDDGSELFGALTGDGWRELRQYDNDGNGFIDEGDDVYSQLVLYRFDEGVIGDLKTHRVDAISLASVSTPMTLLSAAMEEVGRLQSTGFYLSGSLAKTVHQIDLLA